MKLHRINICLGCIFIFLSISSITAQPTYEIDENLYPDKYRQFDFWIGEWDVNLRRINPDNTWHDWKHSIARIYPILGGKAVLELWEDQQDGPPRQVIIGYSLRYFNPNSGKWHLWLNWPGPNRSRSSKLDGQFRHGRGEFFGERPTSDTTSVISRYTFSDITETSLRWDDAFSRDGGKTWTNNWIMEFSRCQNQAPWDSDMDSVLHTYRSGNRCDMPQFNEIQKFTGEWIGVVEYISGIGSWISTDAELNSYKVLGGCSVISFLNFQKEGTPFGEFSLKTYNTFANKYEDGRLDSHPDTHYRPMFGDKSENTLEFIHQNQETGEAKEKYVWTFPTPNELILEKWKSRSGELQKVLSAEFEKE